MSQDEAEPRILVVGSVGHSKAAILAALSSIKYREVVFAEAINSGLDDDIRVTITSQPDTLLRPAIEHDRMYSVSARSRQGKGERKRNKADRWR